MFQIVKKICFVISLFIAISAGSQTKEIGLNYNIFFDQVLITSWIMGEINIIDTVAKQTFKIPFYYYSGILKFDQVFLDSVIFDNAPIIDICFEDKYNIYSEYEAKDGYKIRIPSDFFTAAYVNIYIYTPYCTICKRYWRQLSDYIVDIDAGHMARTQFKQWRSRKRMLEFKNKYEMR